MKIMLAIKRLAFAAGGAERVFCDLHSDLVGRGHDVTIITFEPHGSGSFYSLGADVKKIELGIGDTFKQAGWIETINRIKELRRSVKAEKPDVVVAFMHSMFIPMAFALLGTGVPVVGSEHIVPEHYRRRPLEYLLLILASLFLRKITVLSSTIRSMYPAIVRIRMVAMPNPVKVVENFADVGNETGNLTLLSVGRLDPQKDHDTLIRAFAEISHTFPQWDLKIIGEGKLRPDLERLIEELDLKAKVTMPGVTSEISDQYMAAHVFVLSSRYEAFGMVTAEAMSHGLPVVGFVDCPGTNELIEAGKTGLLVEPGSDRVRALSYAMSQLMSAASLRTNFGTAGREAMNARFSPSQVYDMWEKLLFSIVRDN